MQALVTITFPTVITAKGHYLRQSLNEDYLSLRRDILNWKTRFQLMVTLRCHNVCKLSFTCYKYFKIFMPERVDYAWIQLTFVCALLLGENICEPLKAIVEGI